MKRAARIGLFWSSTALIMSVFVLTASLEARSIVSPMFLFRFYLLYVLLFPIVMYQFSSKKAPRPLTVDYVVYRVVVSVFYMCLAALQLVVCLAIFALTWDLVVSVG